MECYLKVKKAIMKAKIKKWKNELEKGRMTQNECIKRILKINDEQFKKIKRLKISYIIPKDIASPFRMEMLDYFFEGEDYEV